MPLDIVQPVRAAEPAHHAEPVQVRPGPGRDPIIEATGIALRQLGNRQRVWFSRDLLRRLERHGIYGTKQFLKRHEAFEVRPGRRGRYRVRCIW